MLHDGDAQNECNPETPRHHDPHACVFASSGRMQGSTNLAQGIQSEGPLQNFCTFFEAVQMELTTCCAIGADCHLKIVCGHKRGQLVLGLEEVLVLQLECSVDCDSLWQIEEPKNRFSAFVQWGVVSVRCYVDPACALWGPILVLLHQQATVRLQGLHWSGCAAAAVCLVLCHCSGQKCLWKVSLHEVSLFTDVNQLGYVESSSWRRLLRFENWEGARSKCWHRKV
mmetsp:Transcript_76614/g.144333  ORF Transcript_76614/g.144333 Transcript_76614/m.144333 type:complete len:226 (-) Transcript_76614:1293-1970(-)